MGCQSTKESTYVADDTTSYRGKKVSAVTLKNGQIYRYDEVGGRYIEEKRDTGFVKEIVGFDATGTALNFDLGKILEVQCRLTKPDTGGTVLTILITLAGTALIVGLILAVTSARSTPIF